MRATPEHVLRKLAIYTTAALETKSHPAPVGASHSHRTDSKLMRLIWRRTKHQTQAGGVTNRHEAGSAATGFLVADSCWILYIQAAYLHLQPANIDIYGTDHHHRHDKTHPPFQQRQPKPRRQCELGQEQQRGGGFASL
jgi:hypothetical protein